MPARIADYVILLCQHQHSEVFAVTDGEIGAIIGRKLSHPGRGCCGTQASVLHGHGFIIR